MVFGNITPDKKIISASKRMKIERDKFEHINRRIRDEVVGDYSIIGTRLLGSDYVTEVVVTSEDKDFDVEGVIDKIVEYSRA